MSNISQKETSWERRGHNRRPNVVVRGIYAVADWFQDFAPLASAAKRGTGRLVMVTVNIVILLCILIASAAHSLELLQYAGASHGIEYVLLVAWEATFIFSSIVVDQGFERGQPWAVVPWLIFLVGLTFVEASNIIGMADNMAGLLIGIFTPILLLLSKLLLAHQFKVRSKSATQSIDENKPLPQNPVQELPQITEIVEDEKLVLETKIDDQNLIDIESKKDESESLEKLDLEVENDVQNSLDIEPENLVLETPKSDDVSLDIEDQKPVPELNENLDERSEKEQPKSNKQEKTSSGRKTRKSKGSSSKKKPKKLTADQVDYDAIIDVAKRMIDEHPENKTPTKYKLSKAADTTEHHAQKALDMMEQNLDVNLIENLNPNLHQNLDIEPDQKLDLERPKLKLAK